MSSTSETSSDGGLKATVRAYAASLRKQLGVAQGARGSLRVFRTLLAKRLQRGDGFTPASAIGVPMKALRGGELFVRPGTSDLRNASDYYAEDLYLPPPEIAGEELKQICELGSNMGAALTALAARYPSARLLGAEPDPDNVEMVKLNTARYGDRCTVVQAGIWDSDTELVIDRGTHYGEHGFTVRERTEADGDRGGISALSVDSLLARHMPEGPIDYIHVTIEGTEPRMLAAGGAWTDRVRSLRIEAHPEFDYFAPEVIADLERLGYRAWSNPDLPEKWVYAVKTLG